ncbi:hypothetical protein JKA74_18875 [Marivirga sp. S37H4]|uniref:GLPGLI family protein n=1 Tax=Marivirga aurantiaca TaxID=2802615 RepID=A0A935CBF2_9BACT|nr:hypothetical protein [Marivirga aurantiaca]MBK6267115.1 hypothetical protein [Marivirga aurantiaca]
MKFLLIVFSLMLSYKGHAQLKLSDTTQFSLIYNDGLTKDVDQHTYDFFEDYFIRQTVGELTERLFGEEVIQIGDISEKTLYNYYVTSEKLEIIYPEILGFAREVIQRNDTVIQNNELIHFTVFESRRPFSSTTELYYLKNIMIPLNFQDIAEIYRGKNSIFRPDNYHIVYKVTAVSNDGRKLSDIELIEISGSEFDKDKIRKLLSAKK